MAKDNPAKADPAKDSPPQSDSSRALDYPPGRARIEKELAEADRTERVGPGGTWQHNEGLRPDLVNRIAFLRALLALLPPK